MKRKFWIALLSLVCVVACAFIFAACDGEPDSGNGTGNEPAHTITRITVDKSSLTIQRGDFEILAASIQPKGAENKELTWVSSNEDIVSFIRISVGDGHTDYEGNSYDADGNVIMGVEAMAEGKATVAVVAAEIYDVGYVSDGTGGFMLDEAKREAVGKEVVAILNGQVIDKKINGEIRDRVACCDVTVYDGVTENGITFKYVEDFSNGRRYKVASVDKTIDTDVVIPSEFRGKPVVEIDENAFKGCNLITGVTIPGSVEYIGSDWFTDCASLASVIISDGTKYIGYGAFRDCTALKSVTVPNRVEKIYQGAFAGCTSLESITLPFVGQSLDVSYYSYSWFGYIFGSNGNNQAECVPSSLKTVTITGGTKIQNGAFSGCSNITSITLPDSVTVIGDETSSNDSTFDGCTSLTSITVGANNTVYSSQDGILYNKDKTKIKHVPLAISGAIILPDSLTEIGWRAFSGCASITGVTIPADVTSIEVYAFDGCTSLTDVNIPHGVTKIESAAFRNCTSLTSITIPDSVTTVYNEAFKNCPIESATIPANACQYIKNAALQTVVITSGDYISNYAFSGCTSLISVTIPDSVTGIGHSAFYGCTNLAEIKGAKNVCTVGQNVFTGTAYLNALLDASDGVVYWGQTLLEVSADITECTIKEGTVSIPAQIFMESSLTSITIPASVVTIGDEAFECCEELSSVTFAPQSQLKTIGLRAFYGCIALEEISIPASVVSIGYETFDECEELRTVAFGPDSHLEAIGQSTFYNCIALEEISIPASVVSINYYAFGNCSSLRTVTFEPDSQLTSVGSSAFSGCLALTEIVLPASVTSLKSETFRNCIELKTVAAPLDGINYVPSSVLKLTITNGEIIEAGALSKFYNLTELIIGAGVHELKPSALRGLGALQKLTLQDMGYTLGQLFGTEYFNGAVKVNQVVGNRSSNGQDPIISGDLYVPITLTHVTVMGELPRIGAFSYCENLTDIIVLGEVTMIPYYTFYRCTSLRTILLPSALRTVNHFAIYECGGALEKIFYAGTGSWSFPQEVNMGAKVSVLATNDDISTKVYFYSSEPMESGRYWHYDDDGKTPIAWAAQA